MPTDPLQTIAEGGDPCWEQTYDHPVHGELVFRTSRMPKNEDWLVHAARVDEMLASRGLDPDAVGQRTATYAAAMVGIGTIIEPPILETKIVAVEGEAGHQKEQVIRYDPLEDDSNVPVRAWMDFNRWRQEIMARAAEGELGNSSGETPGSASGDSSPEPTASPSTIPA